MAGIKSTEKNDRIMNGTLAIPPEASPEYSAMLEDPEVRDLEELEILEGRYQEAKELFDLFHSREDLEREYLPLQALRSRMAFLQEPFTEESMDDLRQIIRSREEFEELAGPQIVRITGDNGESFSELIPTDLLEDIIVGRCYGIGILKAVGEELVAAGALIWSEEENALGDGLICIIRWFYMDEGFRGQGLGSVLLSEFLYYTEELEVSADVVEIPSESVTDEVKDYFGSRGFPFGNGTSPELSIRIEDALEPKKPPKEATSLKELSERERKVLIWDYLNRNGYRGYLNEPELPEDYFEADLSCFVGRHTAPKALLLIHLTPYGRLRVEYAHSAANNMDELNLLMDKAFSEATLKYPGKTVLTICPDSLDFFLLLGMDYPEQKGFFVEEGMRLRR